MEEQQTCLICKETKPKNKFKTFNQCGKCYQIQYRKNNKDKMIKYKKDYRLANKDKIAKNSKQYYNNNKNKIVKYKKLYDANNKYKKIEQSKQYRENNKDKISESQKQYRENNKNKISESLKQYRENNKDKVTKYNKQYNEKHKDWIIERQKQYYEKNKDKMLEYSKQYHADNFISTLLTSCKARKIEYNLNKAWVIDMLRLYNNTCFYCELEIHEKYTNKFLQMSIDRKNSTLGHVKDNCVLSCLFCNYAKNASDINHFIDFINSLKYNNIDLLNKYKDKQNDKWALDLMRGIKSYCRKEKIECKFTRENIKQMFQNQNGLDYFTQIPMISSKIPYFPFKPSIDRIDNSKPHTPDNCVLVCLAGNYGRNDATVEEYQSHLNCIRKKLK